ncbi:metallophosphoesterase family protein [Ideonella sp. BN130291]|uniref:metallophosphoesterase family protein n=1 Tax=Ideonella sp. BN130291 TaxID=3112940 RepID=UPI002E26BB1A|nr:metallophosphoesterase family protein [Ideonella sp. BN130291]
MRIAAISDIHGNLPALEAVLADIARCGADVTVNLGDILSGPLWPAETADRLMPLGLPAIAGNHERQVLTQALERMSATDAHTVRCLQAEHRDWLASLPPTMALNDEVLLCHGTPTSDLIYWLDSVTPDFGRHGSTGMRPASAAEAQERLGAVTHPLVLCGHTHVPRAMQVGRSLVVNPGSVGLQAYDDEHPHPHHMEVGSPHARWALLVRQPGGWQVEQHAVPYDWATAAAQAERNARPDWAFALRTGRVAPARIAA